MTAALAAALLLAVAFFAGYLTHRARTRATVNRLDAQIGELMASLASISPDAADYRQEVLVHNERKLHATRARLDAFHLLGGAA